MAVSVIDTNIEADTKLTESTKKLCPSLVPEWLNNAFLLKHLRNYYDDEKLTIQHFQVNSATAKGENYASSIYRVTIELTDGHQNTKSLNLILKTALAGEFAFDTLSQYNVYDKEIDFYKRIAPQIKNLAKKLNESDQLLPETFGVCEVNKTILFEDLTLKGYRLTPVHRGFDIESAKAVLKKTAILHACNAFLQQEQPDIFANFKHGLISRSTDGLNIFYLTNLDSVIEVVSKWPDFTLYTEKLRRLRANFMEKGRKAFDAEPNHFNTLIHGDMWINNLMTKRIDDETPIENMIYLDFQFSCWTSATIDLQYFLNTSLEEALRPDRIQELLEFYHKHLTGFLKQLGYRKSMPTFVEFQKQFLEKSLYGFSSSCLVQPIMLNEKTENADFEALVLGDERSIEFKRVVWSAPKAQANLKKLIPFYDRLGVFD